MNYFESEPMKYFAPAASMTKEARHLKLETMAASGQYLYGLKTDGNWSRAVVTPERAALQTRGISKKTGTYGEIQNKVFFWDDILSAFKQTTVILGEVFLPGKIDRDIGSILRCLDDKARARQKDEKLRWRIFDVLALDGMDMMNWPFEERISHIPEVVGRINSPLVYGVEYHEMDDTFFEKMEDIFAAGGEGAVCYKKDSIYIPGKRGPHAWDTCKVKQEISSDIDCLITKLISCERSYHGENISEWELWENTRTGELVHGLYFGEYQIGGPYIPVSKNYWNGWPGAMEVSVYNTDGQLIPLCNVAGLTDDFKEELSKHFEDWYLCPVTIGGMMLSNTGNGSWSVRHPYLKSIRKGDIDPKDCTLSKILN